MTHITRRQAKNDANRYIIQAKNDAYHNIQAKNDTYPRAYHYNQAKNDAYHKAKNDAYITIFRLRMEHITI